jgi:hypothetical protein
MVGGGVTAARRGAEVVEFAFEVSCTLLQLIFAVDLGLDETFQFRYLSVELWVSSSGSQ